MKRLMLFGMLCLFSLNVVALDYTVGVFDYNTLNAIENANVSIHNGTAYMTNNLTDASGYAVLTVAPGEYFLLISAVGYYGENVEINLTANETRQIFLTPFSTEGIIRVIFSDSSGALDAVCIFYQNMRLHSCDDFSNKTSYVQLGQDQTWIVRPRVGKRDFYGNMRGAWDKLRSTSSILLFSIFILIGLYILWSAIK